MSHSLDRMKAPLRRIKRRLIEHFDARLSPKDVFTRIYSRNQWGGAEGEYCSGAGSAPQVTSTYVGFVREFIRTHSISSVADLGCGDFRVGAQIASPEISYVGVDVVDELIARNRDKFGSDRCRFEAADILSDPLPRADLCCVRQVLQHLSNREIAILLVRLAAYRYVLITEHHPAHDRLTRPNHDKPHGRYIRIHDGSGVFLDQPPFSLPSVALVAACPVASPLVAPGEMLNTFLIRNEA